MTANQIKGTLLEFLVRQLLFNCGFTNVKPDGHYVYAQSGNGLFFINGKGSAHDADVLMDPPLQLPFFYPSQLLFECKAYKKTIGINVLRSALGLRYDINEFEIITDETITLRRNHQRTAYAIKDRKRFIYQVGVAAIEKFNASAVEFATNNKIPLLSFRWLLDDNICDLFHRINEEYFEDIELSFKNTLYYYLKNRDIHLNDDHISAEIIEFIATDDIIGEIIRSFNRIINTIYVGLIETGDLIFLRQIDNASNNLFRESNNFMDLKAQIHYNIERPEDCRLSLINQNNNVSGEFRFFIPDRISKLWREYSKNRRTALEIKESYFSRIYIFNGSKTNRWRFPFFVVNIDRDWLETAQRNTFE